MWRESWARFAMKRTRYRRRAGRRLGIETNCVAGLGTETSADALCPLAFAH
jgi:hypothetical protein